MNNHAVLQITFQTHWRASSSKGLKKRPSDAGVYYSLVLQFSLAPRRKHFTGDIIVMPDAAATAFSQVAKHELAWIHSGELLEHLEVSLSLLQPL
jgi:hypothetical protein